MNGTFGFHAYSSRGFSALQVSSSAIHGEFLLHSPTPNDSDQKETFALYLLPGEAQNRKVCLH